MIKQWTRNHTYILIGIVVVSILIYSVSYFIIIQPLKYEASILNDEVAMYEKQLNKIENQSDEGLPEDLSAVRLQVPSEQSLDDLLLNLHQAASATNVSIDFIESSNTGSDVDESSQSDLQRSQYALDASAEQLSDLNNFLDEILLTNRLIIINTINLYQTEIEAGVSLTFSTFHTED